MRKKRNVVEGVIEETGEEEKGQYDMRSEGEERKTVSVQ